MKHLTLDSALIHCTKAVTGQSRPMKKQQLQKSYVLLTKKNLRGSLVLAVFWMVLALVRASVLFGLLTKFKEENDAFDIIISFDEGVLSFLGMLWSFQKDHAWAVW